MSPASPPSLRRLPAKPKAGPILIVAAWKPELAGLQRFLRAHRGIARGLALRAIGVGLVDAAAGTMAAIRESGASAVVLVGTAGRYPGAAAAISIRDAVLVETILLVAPEALAGTAYFPAPMVRDVATERSLVRAMATAFPMRRVRVACPLAITADQGVARILQMRTRADVENLESFAVASAAARAGLPFAAVLGVSNTVGPDAHGEWKIHAAAAATAACAAVAAWVTAGARQPAR